MAMCSQKLKQYALFGAGLELAAALKHTAHNLGTTVPLGTTVLGAGTGVEPKYNQQN